MKTTKVLQILTLLLIAIILNSCGTTHHFVPPRPLENKEYLISLAWHFDFDKGYKLPAVFPDVNFYSAIDRNHVFGVGLQIPYFVSHLSFARYFKNNEDAYLNTFLHLNQPFGYNNNPYIELGASYSFLSKNLWQNGSAGLAYGNGAINPAGLFTFREINDQIGGGSKNRFIPFIKYQIGGSDVAFSLNNYFGIKKSILDRTLKLVQTENDTLLSIQVSNIDSITSIIDSSFYEYTKHGAYGIFLSNGDTVKIQSERIYLMCGGPGLLIGMFAYANFNQLEEIFDYYGYHYFDIIIPQDNNITSSTRCLLNPTELLSNWKQQETLIIPKYPLNFDKTIIEIEKGLHDYSVGLSIQRYDFSK